MTSLWHIHFSLQYVSIYTTHTHKREFFFSRFFPFFWTTSSRQVKHRLQKTQLSAPRNGHFLCYPAFLVLLYLQKVHCTGVKVARSREQREVKSKKKNFFSDKQRQLVQFVKVSKGRRPYTHTHRHIERSMNYLLGKKQKMMNNEHHMNGFAATNGHGGGAGGHHHHNKVANPEMCAYCFDVLNAELNNVGEPRRPNFTNDP